MENARPLFCENCQHAWVPYKEAYYSTAKNFVLIRGVVQRCPQCRRSDKIKINGVMPNREIKMGFPNKMTSRELCIQRYGHIDLASGHWADKDKWIKYFHVPQGWFPGWKVLDTQQTVSVIACNIDMHAPLLKALTAIHERGLGGVLRTYDGAFAMRAVRASSLISAHAWGLAIDINASINPLGSEHGDFTKHMDAVQCFTAQGFAWGGNFHGRKDDMHFSYCFEG